MKKLFLALCLFAVAIDGMNAGPVDRQKAQQLGSKFLGKSQLRLAITVADRGVADYYAFNVSNGEGRTGMGRVDALAAVAAASEWDGVIQPTIESVALWPNPVDNILYLNVTDGANVSVFDMTGRMVKRERYTGQLDVSHLAPGIYAVKAESFAVRFVKE